MKSKDIAVDSNQGAYGRFVHFYKWRELWPPERVVFEKFKPYWHEMRMLDLGVGTGRTTYSFARVVKEYVGIDYVPAMIKKCVEKFGQSNSVRFIVSDARDLSVFPKGYFDFVLFSWCGIDAASHEGRKRIFAEVRRVLKRDGYFFFSSHNLNAFPFRPELPRINFKEPLRLTYRWVRMAYRALRLRWLYQHVDVAAIKAKPYAILIHPDHRFKLKVYFISPHYQLTQLSEAGFETIAVYDMNGQEVDAKTYAGRGYLSYLCRPAD